MSAPKAVTCSRCGRVLEPRYIAQDESGPRCKVWRCDACPTPPPTPLRRFKKP